ncbi:putative ATPase [Rivularia sp. PCC 7116]|uniref:ATP-binding sensor histidine kinase n=1 Tax=Rivularia sp. PCC 7116 TaxID=373994 RepID=UPI00029F2ECF|nr:ATP-binding sensor histidine kinase [Rivularia sp. PCC 7116]AFY53117.1 putative ATPase [Rivularia sp. PCC 7116]
MSSIYGYQILKQLYNSSRTIVYRGVRQADRKPVIIKRLKNSLPSFSELLHFRNQYSITKNICSPYIIQSYGLEEDNRNICALIMEDMGGISLQEYFTNNLKTIYTASIDNVAFLEEFIKIAISLCDALDALYRYRIIHKDIKPANILINPATKQVKIIDFSIASLLPKETQTLISPSVLEGTLSYISPEQTGRMNRGIDYRTDLYSLGVTFYELLTGELPFKSQDAIELVHCHIAKQPPNINKPHPNSLLIKERGKEIPQVLSDIVMKLMAKNAEDRYQSALGLKYDLEICLKRIRDIGKIENFIIAQRDICDRFIIPEKLYGREREVEQILAAFDRVTGTLSCLLSEKKNDFLETKPCKEYKAELILVGGFSGIGKTALVNEVHKPIIKQRGYFIKGKFDQFNRNIPLDGFIQAFRDLMGQILSESDAQLSSWKQEILKALGDNAQVIIDVIPELELVIDKQPSAPELFGIAAQNRFNLLFQKFIQVFTTKAHPLVVFLDDLQWADSASLKMMQLLLCESQTSYLLMIGAYRNNEVFPAHPLMLVLDIIKKNGTIVNTITLKNLNKASLNNLLADTLSCSKQVAKPLTNIIYQKTKGNPFFATQFFKALHNDGLINFDTKAGYWQYDISEVHSAGLTNDVVEFMVLQLSKLPESTQNVLKLAGCIGNKFDLETLSIISEQSNQETAACLWYALQNGIVLPQGDVYKLFVGEDIDNNSQATEVVEYKFLHDRVQQAAYSLIPEEQKQKTHWQIGQALLTAISKRQLEEKLFEVVNQLNNGLSFCKEDAKTQEKIARLNLQAGRKAKESTAYTAAISYFSQGISLLAFDCWENQYELSFELYRLLAETEHLNGNFERAEKLVYDIINKANSNILKADLYNLLVVQFTLEGKYEQANKLGEKGLILLGIQIPKDNLQSSIYEQLKKVRDEFKQQEIVSILNKPMMNQEQIKTAIKLLINLDPPNYITGNLNLYMFVSLKAVLLSLEYGNAAESAKAYANYGLILGTVLGDYQTGYEFGTLAYNLSKIHQNQGQLCKASLLLSGWLYSWNQPIADAEKVALSGYQAGLESGEIQFAGYNLFALGCILNFKGTKLKQIQKEISNWLHFTKKTKNQLGFEILSALQFTVFKLLGENSSNLKYIQYQSPLAVAIDRTYQCQFFYLLNQPDLSLKHALEAEKLVLTMAGFVTSGEYHFYVPLTFLNCLPSMQKEQQKSYWEKIKSHEDKLKIWAEQCPQNFQHKYLLLQAEINRVNCDFINAIDNYDKAISQAKANKFIHEEALANELAGKFYLDWNKDKFAQIYIEEAYYCYAKWEAKAKTDDLEKRYPQILANIIKTQQNYFPTLNQSKLTRQVMQTTSSSSSYISENLDLSSILKASQALSSEIQLEKLISKLMQVVIENAGAEKAALILLNEDTLTLMLKALASSSGSLNLLDVPYQDSQDIPTTLINHVKRTQKIIVLDDGTAQSDFIADSYFIVQQPKSSLCMPILDRGKLIGLLYLENNLTIGAFTQHRVEILNLLCTQAAISLENAQLYSKLENYSHTLEQKVEERTQEVTQKAAELESILKELKRTQSRLIQTEKMSGLGQLVAGIAHEINNPISFIYGNLNPASEYAESLIELINLYKRHYPQSPPEIESKIKDIELDYLIEDLPKILDSIETGAVRIREIVLSLRNFSRLDEAEIKPVDIHAGIDSALLILQHKFSSNDKYPEIEVIKNYNQLPAINCYASELNQVFMNIISNAIDALRDKTINKPKITVSTSFKDTKTIFISIKDNGIGISKSTLNKIFDPFFSTKPVGSGTGLGLSTSYSIVVEKHRGNLSCNSTLGERTEFLIELPLK